MTVCSENSRDSAIPARLRRSPEYRAMRDSRREHRKSFVLQARERAAGEVACEAPRFGLTVTKKTGNAVERNRIRRRLREAVRAAAPGHARKRFDYVLIARRAALDEPFEAIVRQLADTLDRAGRMEANPRRRDARNGGAGQRDERHAPGHKEG